MPDDTTSPDPTADQPVQPDTGAAVDYQAEAEKWQALARKHEDRAKTNSNAAKELDQLRKQSMTEIERAAAEAEARGRSAATTDFGKRLARSDFTAAAARRNPGYDITGAVDLLDLARFVGEDGEPDGKAIAAAVERLVPEPAGTPTPSFDGGTRTAAPVGADMNAMLRRASGRG